MDVKLNQDQKDAVEHRDGPLLIIAGAGTGKTQVITQRIMHIMNEGWAKPSEILALTFTEKSAQEMEERVDREMPLGYEEPTISTFHSFCDKLLRQEAFFLGIDADYKLMNESESYIFFKKHIFDFSLDTLRPLNNPAKFIGELLKHFSRLQDEDVSTEEYLTYAKKLGFPETLEMAKTYKEFTEKKLEEGRMTFADLITMSLKLFREKPQILKKYQEKFKYVLVDEYQDTNYSQNLLVNTIVFKGKKTNITVVGDDDQAIYKFRGAAISNILQFKEVYPDAKRIVLTTNYRSNQEILDSAYALIKNNDPYRLEVTENIEKRLVAVREKVENAVQLIPTATALEESEAIVQEILKLTGKEADAGNYQIFDSKGQSSFLSTQGQYKLSDIAILVRAKSHADEIIPLLRYYQIPYKFEGKKGLYSRPEVKYFISFLQTLQDYKNSTALFNVLQLEVLNLEIRDFIEIFSEAKRRRISAFELLEDLLGVRVGSKKGRSRFEILERTFSQQAQDSLRMLMGVYEKAFKMIKTGNSATEILYLFLTETGYLKHLELGDAESEFKLENISKYFQIVRRFEQNSMGNVYEYIDYLEYSIEVGEVPSIDEDTFLDYDAVHISTIHGAKGLEYPVVFMPSLVKGRFPSRNRSETLPLPLELVKEKLPDEEVSDCNIQEERRLFYVGATRAKERLFLSASQYYAGGKTRSKPSVFLNEILSREVLEEFEDVKPKNDFSFTKDTAVDDVDYKLLVRDLGKRISYSEMNDYEVCPKKYRYKYVLKIPVSVGHPAIFGTVIHATLREFYARHKVAKEGLEGIFPKPTYLDLKDIYEKRWSSSGYLGHKHESKRKDNGYKILKYFFENIYTGNEDIVDLERSFKVDVDGVAVVGFVDRIDGLGEKEVQLIDYKTGKSKTQKEVEKDVQLMMYGLFAKKTLGVSKITASLIFLDEGITLSTEITEDDLNFVKDKILTTTDLIKKANFKANPGFYCTFCDYKGICDDASV